MTGRRPLIAGNWKMYGRSGDLSHIKAMAAEAGSALDRIEALICPPAPYIREACAVAGPIAIGAQDCSTSADDGARTGDVNAAMLAECGARYVIVGHSERRTLFGETDAIVRAKASAATAAGLAPIVCVGETAAERAEGQTAAVIARQVRQSVPEHAGAIVVAYEPVWAIGGTTTPKAGEIGAVHAVVRDTLRQVLGAAAAEAVRILYGGAVNAQTAPAVFAASDVDGALVGRASLKASDFAAIILAHPAAK